MVPPCAQIKRVFVTSGIFFFFSFSLSLSLRAGWGVGGEWGVGVAGEYD